jgi:hypothetical protein
LRPYPTGGLISVEFRHAYIEEDEIGAKFFRRCDRLQAIERRFDGVAGAF